MNDTLSITSGDTANTTSGDIEAGRAFVMNPRNLPADHPDARIANDRTHGLYVRQGVEGVQNGEAAPPADAEYISAQNPTLIVSQVESRIAKLSQQLAENVGFDPVTGDPVPLLKGRVRENAVRELAQLQHSTLPFAKIQAAEVARAKATLPTQADKFQAELAKERRINAEALEIADRKEAEARAERIIAQRRAQSMG